MPDPLGHRSAAFTLIELLVVISIIAVLAGLLMPAIGLIQRQARQVRCSNNLRQVAMCIEAYRQDHNDDFPWHLTLLTQADYDVTLKSLRCPCDPTQGSDVLMGRPISVMDDKSRLHEPGSSYMFEMSNNPGTNQVYPTGGKMLIATDASYFYRDMTDLSSLDLATLSWQKAKLHQQKRGNLQPGHSYSSAADYGSPFPSSQFPILRCYWHSEWVATNLDTERKVNNVALGFNIFPSTPMWERDVNPKIPK